MASAAHDDAFKYYNHRVPYSPIMAERLARGLSFTSETRILDVACGNGTLSEVIAPHVGRIIGLDVSKGMLSVAYQDPKIEYVEWDFNGAPYTEGRFDHLVIGRALHWLSLQNLSHTFRASVEPEGFLVICGARIDASDWYMNFRRLLLNYGRMSMSQPGERAMQRLPSIGFRHHGRITDRFQMKLSPDSIMNLALSLQPVTKAIEADLANFKSRLLEVIRPVLRDGVVTADCISTADAWAR